MFNPSKFNKFIFIDEESKRVITILAYNSDNALKALKRKVGVQHVFYKLINQKEVNNEI